MAGLKQFKFIPANLMEWSRWMRDQDLENALGNPDATERVLTSTVDGERSWVRRFDRWPAQFRGSANQALSTSAITISLSTTDYDPGVNYALAGGIIFIETAGYYKITYTVYVTLAAGGNSGDMTTWLTREDESTVLPGSYAASYIEEGSNTPDAACTGSCLMLLSAGQGVAIVTQQTGASVDATTDGDRCSLTIERVR